MEIIEQLEQRFERLLHRIKELEEENQLLKQELESEVHTKEAVNARIENLLSKIQEEIE